VGIGASLDRCLIAFVVAEFVDCRFDFFVGVEARLSAGQAVVEAIAISRNFEGPSACAVLFLVLHPLFCAKGVVAVSGVKIVGSLDAQP
jgi:hypothetical protein